MTTESVVTFGNERALSSDRGLTLLELILSLTILSFVLLASSNLWFSAIRLFDFFVSGDVRLQNELRYVILYLEKDLRSGREPVVQCGQGAPCTIQVTDANDSVITYQYSPGTGELARIEGSVRTVLSTGTLVEKTENGVAQPIFEIVPGSDNQLVEINLSARGTRGANAITLPGISEVIMLRGAPSS